MKTLLVVTLILGCMAFLEARTAANSKEAGQTFFALGDSSTDGDVGRPIVGNGAAVGDSGGAVGDGNDDGGDTPDSPDSPDGPGVVAAGGFGNEVGDTPDDIDTPDRNFPSGGAGRPIVKNPNQRVVEAEEAGDPGQIVGNTGSAGTTVGIVVGVVALVGVAAGVAIFVIKKRN